MKTFCRASLALALILSGIAAAKAELGKPMAVVSIASYDEQMANLDFLGGLGGQQNVSRALDQFLTMMTQGQGLKGLDKSKPWGFAVMADGEGQQMLGFLPVSSAKELTDALALIVGQASDEGNGVLKITPPQAGQEFFVREQDGWAFVTDQKYEGALPDDPAKLLAGLNTEYDIAARAYLQNIPEPMKQGAIQQLKGFMDMMAAMQARNNEANAELQREAIDLQMKALEQCVNDADQVTLGWKLDKAAKNTHVDFTLTAKPGSQLAESLKGLENSKTDFSGFLNPEFAVNFLSAQTHSQADIDNALATMAAYRKQAEAGIDNDEDLADDEARKNVKTVLNQLFDVVDATIKTGKTDLAAAVNLAPEKLQAAVGTLVADGAALESAVKNLVELAKGEDQFNENVTVKFDVETYKSIRFHQAMVELPDEDAQKVLGENLEIYLGIGPKSAYLAAGKDSLAFIKSIIDASAAQAGKQVLPMQLTISLVNILEFAASVKPDGPAAMIADQVKELKGKDRILVTAKPISNGVTGRLEIEDGVLEAISMIAKARAGVGVQGGDVPVEQFQ